MINCMFFFGGPFSICPFIGFAHAQLYQTKRVMHISKWCGPLAVLIQKPKKINNLNQLNDYELTAQNTTEQKYNFVCVFTNFVIYVALLVVTCKIC